MNILKLSEELKELLDRKQEITKDYLETIELLKKEYEEDSMNLEDAIRKLSDDLDYMLIHKHSSDSEEEYLFTGKEICINCGEMATHKHHVVPKVLGGNNGSNCVFLCDKCHGLIHNVEFNDKQLSHSKLIKIGIEKARAAGKQIGAVRGKKLNVKKAIEAKEMILNCSKDFYGDLGDSECMELIGIANNTYYKYKRELKEEIAQKLQEECEKEAEVCYAKN